MRLAAALQKQDSTPKLSDLQSESRFISDANSKLHAGLVFVFCRTTRCCIAMSMQRLSNTYTHQPSRHLQHGQNLTSTHRVQTSKRRRLEHKHIVLLILAAAEHVDKVGAKVPG